MPASTSSPPRLNDRARGWLRHIWDKSTTADDWSSSGEPHAWWDHTSTQPMCSLPRFDLHETGYVLPIMCDITPAWREVYTRIADGLVERYTTFWASVDWLTLIGHDPDQANYPPEYLINIPEHLRGRYDIPGWTANGVEPWGLQPDPLGADGNLFTRGFFNLLMCFYRYVSGDDKWEKPFQVCGYRDQLFEWDQPRLVDFIHAQWKERPQGPHCENTKVWPFCVSGAGSGLQLYDQLHGTQHAAVYEQWLEYAQQHFLQINGKGNIESFAFYYDPIERTAATFRDHVDGYAALAPLMYNLPKNRAFTTRLYEHAMNKLGWNDPRKPILELHPDPRFLTLAILIARELGDNATETRLRSYAEENYEPRFWGENNEYFGWWFHTGEPWPRGQLSSLMMVTELGGQDAWSRIFQHSNAARFQEPTLRKVDYPALGIAQCWNHHADGTMLIETVCPRSSNRGRATTWEITNLPNAREVQVTSEGHSVDSWRVLDDRTIEVHTTMDDRIYTVHTGYFGPGSLAQTAGNADAVSGDAPTISVTADSIAQAAKSKPCSGSCC